MSEKLSGVGGLGCVIVFVAHGDGARCEIPPSRGVLRASGVVTSESIPIVCHFLKNNNNKQNVFFMFRFTRFFLHV